MVKSARACAYVTLQHSNCQNVRGIIRVIRETIIDVAERDCNSLIDTFRLRDLKGLYFVQVNQEYAIACLYRWSVDFGIELRELAFLFHCNSHDACL